MPIVKLSGWIAYHHAHGQGQEVQVTSAAGRILVEVSDQGPGFDMEQGVDGTEHLGVQGMRERAESLGGRFKVQSQLGHGTKVVAWLPLSITEGNDHHG